MFRWEDIKRQTEDGWTKYFADGSVEVGAISNPKVSWTRGKHDGMIAVSLQSGDNTVFLCSDDGPAKFWQSDDFECVFGSNQPTMILRRIQMKVGDKAWKTVEIDLRTGNINEYVSKHKI